MTHYKQCIQISYNVTNIMKLPCIYSCHKEGNDDHLVFLMYDWDEYGQYIKAQIGDWLCEGYDGLWRKLTNEEYERYTTGTAV